MIELLYGFVDEFHTSFKYGRLCNRDIQDLQHVKDDKFLDELVNFDGGQEARDSILPYLNKYGMIKAIT